MIGSTVSHVETTRLALQNPQACREYLRAALEDFSSGNFEGASGILFVFFEALDLFNDASSRVGMTPGQLKSSLFQQSDLTARNFSDLYAFALSSQRLGATVQLDEKDRAHRLAA